MNKDQLTIAYIGNGKSTNRYHLPFSSLRDNIKIKSIWKHSDRPSPWESLEGVNYTTELADILEDPEVDVIVITTPASSHYDLAKRALEAGKHVVVEKPVTLDLKEAQELYDLAESKGLILQSYQNRRFDSDFLTMQKVIESGVLGDIYEVEINYDYYRPEVPENAKEYSREESYVFTHASHTVDQVISYFGQPESYDLKVRDLLGRGKMIDYYDFDLYYEGLTVSIRSSYLRAKSRSKFIVYGTRGVFEKITEDRQEADLKKFYMPSNADFGLDSPEQYGLLTYYDEDGNFHEEKVVSERGDYGRYYDALYETIIGKAPVLVERDETLKVMEILEEASKVYEN